VLLAALVVVAVSAVVPSNANALDSYYNCVLKPSGQWCDGRANGTYDGLNGWDYTEGWYPGTWDGSVIACEHVINPSNGAELGTGGTCASNWTSHVYGSVTGSYEAEVRQYSGGNHSINGYADSDL